MTPTDDCGVGVELDAHYCGVGSRVIISRAWCPLTTTLLTMTLLTVTLLTMTLLTMQGGIMLPSDSEKDDGDYILVCGFGRVGQAVCDLLTSKLVRYKAFDMDPYRVAEARELGLPVFYADARRPDLTTYHSPPTSNLLPPTTYHSILTHYSPLRRAQARRVASLPQGLAHHRGRHRSGQRAHDHRLRARPQAALPRNAHLCPRHR